MTNTQKTAARNCLAAATGEMAPNGSSPHFRYDPALGFTLTSGIVYPNAPFQHAARLLPFALNTTKQFELRPISYFAVWQGYGLFAFVLLEASFGPGGHWRASIPRVRGWLNDGVSME